MKTGIAIIFIFSSFVLLGRGPHNIKIESCLGISLAANGKYTKGLIVDGCDCYNKDNMLGRIIFRDGFFAYESGVICMDGGILYGGFPVIKSGSNCSNILKGISANACLVIKDKPSDPMISNWGLIMLGILLAICAVIALKN